ncbi:MobF family relaxase [Phytoactinopolyspora halotolerans]|uniref:Relaxase domain-containing protein n=1 Tax=Phytoactinopolyspora halotolerans TaxID=1981512 RepID=A0A6L9SHD7_9ACTN|nr:MobF family relaxase [Phytoactinopolyspora halotolerans]NEE03842.1 relaxase domain-containing protein [Phytoactinopolyspora halotolerans]
MRVMSAGAGFAYLLKSVAAGDGDRKLGTPLTRYYAEKGTPPGRWLGSGVADLGDGRLVPGDVVGEEQLRLLLGEGRDPVTGEALGRAYPQYTAASDNAPSWTARAADGSSARVRSGTPGSSNGDDVGHGRRRAVAGYDFTFSVPKSVSVLWALADADTQEVIAAEHHGAIADVMALVERDIAATRTGHAGPDGAVAQVDVTGVIATAYDHFDSRSGDPQLHTHVVISNKVRTVRDGVWRSLDGRPLHASVVALSEHYRAVLADRLTRALGVRWVQHLRGPDRNPAWDIAGVPDELLREFSTRSTQIDRAKDVLLAQYVAAHGRQPSAQTVIRLRAQATLATRPEKTVRSLAELTVEWRHRAEAVLGEDATVWTRRILASQRPRATVQHERDVAPDDVAALADAVVRSVGEKRSTWLRWNLHAEASRQMMGIRFASTADRDATMTRVVDAAEQRSLRLTPPEAASTPEEFLRADGSSAFRPRHGAVFTSAELLDAEDRLLAHARTSTGPVIDEGAAAILLRRGQGRRLAGDQRRAVTRVVSSGRVVDVLVGPAGAGKTSTMTALRTVWEHVHGHGTVVGLAPSAAAAQVLADDLSIACENTAKWLHEHRHRRATLDRNQLVIIDEASLAGTFTLDAIASHAADAGAKILLVGDWAQLGAVEVGGAFALLARDRDDVAELNEVRRFRHDWEKHASLRLRSGDADVIDSYQAHGRIIDASTDHALDAAYSAWRADVTAGRASIMVADTHDTVTALNTRARADRIESGRVKPGGDVALRDGTRAGVGDRVITRRNERRLTTGDRWVKNGDRWTVTATHADGSITVRRAGRQYGATTTLPSAYAAEQVELAYAVTAHRAQGATVDTAHAIVTSASMTREALYVAMTRGRERNTVYVATDQPDLETHLKTPDEELTVRHVLEAVLQNVGAEASAHETLAAEQDRHTNIAQLAAEYDTIAAAAQRERWVSQLTRSGLTPDQADSLSRSAALGPLTAALRRAEAHNIDLDRALPQLVSQHSLTDAHDVAAVLHKRLTTALVRHQPRIHSRTRAGFVAGLIPRATGAMTDEMRTALLEREHLIEQRARFLAENAIRRREPWTRHLGPPPLGGQQRNAWLDAVTTIAAYRDRHAITEPLPLGPTGTDDHRHIDTAYARAALDDLRRLANTHQPTSTEPISRPQPDRTIGPSL